MSGISGDHNRVHDIDTRQLTTMNISTISFLYEGEGYDEAPVLPADVRRRACRGLVEIIVDYMIETHDY